MWVRTNSQEVGLEAATLRRVRNSSLVERARAENDTGLSMPPKPQDPGLQPRVGRGAFTAARKAYRKERWSAVKRGCWNK